MELEFNEKYGTEDRPCSVYFKGIDIFDIRYEDYRKEYWVESRGYINFLYITANPDNDLDFIEPYKYSKTLEGAKKNCKKIMSDYIKWLTE